MDDPQKAGLAEKNRNSCKLACRKFVVSPPHSPGDCIQALFYPCPSVVPVLQDFQIIKINGLAIGLKRFLLGIYIQKKYGFLYSVGNFDRRQPAIVGSGYE